MCCNIDLIDTILKFSVPGISRDSTDIGITSRIVVAPVDCRTVNIDHPRHGQIFNH